SCPWSSVGHYFVEHNFGFGYSGHISQVILDFENEAVIEDFVLPSLFDKHTFKTVVGFKTKGAPYSCSDTYKYFLRQPENVVTQENNSGSRYSGHISPVILDFENAAVIEDFVLPSLSDKHTFETVILDFENATAIEDFVSPSLSDKHTFKTVAGIETNGAPYSCSDTYKHYCLENNYGFGYSGHIGPVIFDFENAIVIEDFVSPSLSDKHTFETIDGLKLKVRHIRVVTPTSIFQGSKRMLQHKVWTSLDKHTFEIVDGFKTRGAPYSCSDTYEYFSRRPEHVVTQAIDVLHTCELSIHNLDCAQHFGLTSNSVGVDYGMRRTSLFVVITVEENEYNEFDEEVESPKLMSYVLHYLRDDELCYIHQVFVTSVRAQISPDRTDFESWQQHIHLYCLGKENGVNILKLIDEGPFKMGKFRETLAEGALPLGPERDRVFADLEYFTSRFVTAVQLTRGLKQSNYNQLYAYLKQHEAHANENKMMLERYMQHAIDPFALVSNVLPHQYPSQSSVNPQHAYVLSENGAVLDEEQLLFIAGGQTNTFDDDVDEAPVQDLALNGENVFQVDQCDAFDYDVDEALTPQTMFMENLSSADPIYDEAGPSYDSDILSEVQDHDNYVDSVGEYHEVHEMQNDV
nr:retrovirus-related Pol polyprotein from transposon TNT 1-94 [Tanacetum cinerariifolium]